MGIDEKIINTDVKEKIDEEIIEARDISQPHTLIHTVALQIGRAHV